jgi:hypothetical protein
MVEFVFLYDQAQGREEWVGKKTAGAFLIKRLLRSIGKYCFEV